MSIADAQGKGPTMSPPGSISDDAAIPNGGCGTSGHEATDHSAGFLSAQLSRGQLVDNISAALRNQETMIHRDAIARFTRQVERSMRVQSWWESQVSAPEKLRDMDIVRLIAQSQIDNDIDEALWRGFLAGHFGRRSADPRNSRQVESAGNLLCSFKDEPVWTWDEVSSAFPVFRQWLSDHQALLADLRFCNHRKYESPKPEALCAVIESFLLWVAKYGESPERAFATDTDVPEEAFDILFRRLNEVHRFGRTACFDTLVLMAELALLPVRPGAVYLEGATGPLRGAIQLWGEQPVTRLEELSSDLAREVPIPFVVVEDALCMWQK